ncbi:hypothetical protein HNY73_007278 [Argiope bruennichi]|uniref:Uncharacterized protein n=1 Tax=Argiope bruennichi TaxID=94029 RepID=A0A8T0FDG7_ARGBR|nr:hypothetical protein HNY73_007278 [Argiope bruennichi]
MDIGDTSDTEEDIDNIINIHHLLKRGVAAVFKLFEKLTEVFESFVCCYNSIRAREGQMDEHTNSYITGGLLVICESFEVIEAKLSLIQQEVRFLDIIIDSTTENLKRFFSYPAKTVSNLLEDVRVEMGQILEKLADIINACQQVMAVQMS